jgi:hypothetical protein
MQRKSKIYLEQRGPGLFYKVVKLANRTEPMIGKELKKIEVEQLLAEDVSLSIEIVKRK